MIEVYSWVAPQPRVQGPGLKGWSLDDPVFG